MLYTGNANRLIFWILIPLLIISYITFRAMEWHFTNDTEQHKLITEQHAINLRHQTDINCLVLGGSNSWFGISAEQLSNQNELNCYNLSLLGEGFSFKAYWNYIRSLPIEVEEIEYVFYSSIVQYKKNRYLTDKYQNAHDGIGILGDNSFKLLGPSIAYYIKKYLENGSFLPVKKFKYPLPSFYGDFDFSKYDECRFDIRAISHQNNNYISLEMWSKFQLSEIISIFPNSNMYFVLPSELRDGTFDLSIQAKMIEHMQRSVFSVNKKNISSFLIVQPPLPDNSLTCDGQHHTNAKGREFRTSNLIQLFQATF